MHFSFLDETKTIEKTKKFLKQYNKLHIIEKSLKISLKSPIISPVPSSAPIGNTQEDLIVSKLDERRYANLLCELIRNVVYSIEDDVYREIIRLTYLSEGYFDRQIMFHMHLESAQYYCKKKEALLVFAQSMPKFKALNGETIDLLVYKKQTIDLS